MSRTLALLLGLLPAVAAAGPFVWVDARGDQQFTDDPSRVPVDRRHTLRDLGDGDDDPLSAVGGSEADPVRDPAEDERIRIRLEQRRLLEAEAEVLQRQVTQLERDLARARNEERKYRAGGRVGAADRAREAGARASDLEARLAARRKDLLAVVGRLELLGAPR